MPGTWPTEAAKQPSLRSRRMGMGRAWVWKKSWSHRLRENRRTRATTPHGKRGAPCLPFQCAYLASPLGSYSWWLSRVCGIEKSFHYPSSTFLNLRHVLLNAGLPVIQSSTLNSGCRHSANYSEYWREVTIKNAYFVREKMKEQYG